MTIVFIADTEYHCQKCDKNVPGKFILTGHNEAYCKLCAIKYLINKVNEYEDLITELKQ